MCQLHHVTLTWCNGYAIKGRLAIDFLNGTPIKCALGDRPNQKFGPIYNTPNAAAWGSTDEAAIRAKRSGSNIMLRMSTRFEN